MKRSFYGSQGIRNTPQLRNHTQPSSDIQHASKTHHISPLTTRGISIAASGVRKPASIAASYAHPSTQIALKSSIQRTHRRSLALSQITTSISVREFSTPSKFSPAMQEQQRQKAEALLRDSGINIDDMIKDLEENTQQQHKILLTTPDDELIAYQTKQNRTNSLEENAHQTKHPIRNTTIGGIISDDELTELENPHEVYKFDRKNIVPDMFEPGSLEHTVAMFLQAEQDGVLMFPIFLRRQLFLSIIRNIEKVMHNVPDPDMVEMEQIFDIILDTMVHIGPELCQTHEQALNILFPLAPRIGNIVELPNIPGKVVVSKREYIDNRYDDNSDMDDFDRGRIMILTYECLHPSVKGKFVKTHLPFEMEPYKLIITQNERGLEEYMHHKGLIDIRSGTILDPDSARARQFEAQLSSMTPLLHGKGPGTSQLRLEQQKIDINATNAHAPPADIPEQLRHRHVHESQHDYTVTDHQFVQDHERVLLFAGDSPTRELANLSSSIHPMSSGDGNFPYQREIPSNPPGEPSRIEKEYLKPRVITGTAAMITYKRLMQDLLSPQDGIMSSSSSSSIGDTHRAMLQEDLALQRQISQMNKTSPHTVQMQVAGQALASSAHIHSKGASYDPSTMFTPHSTHNAPAVPNRLLSSQEQRQIDQQIDQHLQSTAYTSTKDSGIIEQLQANRQRAIEQVKATANKSQQELEDENKAEYEEFLQEQLQREQAYLDKGYSVEDAQRRAYDDYQQEQEQHSKQFLQQLEQDGLINYQQLPDHYKKKYHHCIITRGIGSGLPDPLQIDLNDDILAIYKHANVALMDFLSEQWSLMLEEKRMKGEELPHNADITRFRLIATVAAAGNYAFTAEYIQEIFTRVMTLSKNEPLKEMLEEDAIARQLAENNQQKTIEQQQQQQQQRDGDDQDTYTKDSFRQIADQQQDDIQQYLREKREQLERLSLQRYDNDDDDDNRIDHSIDHKTQGDTPSQQRQQHATINKRDDFDEISSNLLSSSPSEAAHETENGYVKYNGKLYTPQEYATLVYGRSPTPVENAPIPSELKSFLLRHRQHRAQLKVAKNNEQDRKQRQRGGGSGGNASHPRNQQQHQRQQQRSQHDHEKSKHGNKNINTNGKRRYSTSILLIPRSTTAYCIASPMGITSSFTKQSMNDMLTGYSSSFEKL